MTPHLSQSCRQKSEFLQIWHQHPFGLIRFRWSSLNSSGGLHSLLTAGLLPTFCPSLVNQKVVKPEEQDGQSVACWCCEQLYTTQLTKHSSDALMRTTQDFTVCVLFYHRSRRGRVYLLGSWYRAQLYQTCVAQCVSCDVTFECTKREHTLTWPCQTAPATSFSTLWSWRRTQSRSGPGCEWGRIRETTATGKKHTRVRQSIHQRWINKWREG